MNEHMQDYKKREDGAPHSKGRHEKFQFGTNPMKMTPFEESLKNKEVKDREKARLDYVAGIQGRDGGHHPDQQFKSYDGLYDCDREY